MFDTRGKKGLRKQVEDIAGDLTERIAPHVDHAREQLAPYVDQAREGAVSALSDARDKASSAAAPYVEETRRKTAPAIAVATPVLAGAREKAAPYVSEARDRISSDVLPVVNDKLGDARQQVASVAGPYVKEARKETRRRSRATAAALRGEIDAPSKGSKLKKALLVGGVLGLAAYAYAKLTAKDGADAWQSSYAPPAPPSPTPAAAPSASANKPPAPKPPAPVANDAAAATPDEAAADKAIGEAHPITTPDNPVEQVDVRDEDQPGT